MPTSLHRPILTSHVVLYYVKISLHKRSLIKLFTRAHWSTDPGKWGIAPALSKGGQRGGCAFS